MPPLPSQAEASCQRGEQSGEDILVRVSFEQVLPSHGMLSHQASVVRRPNMTSWDFRPVLVTAEQEPWQKDQT